MLVVPALIVGFSLWMAVEASRRGNRDWLWIILVFQPFGAIVYFLSEYLGGVGAGSGIGPLFAGRKALRLAEAEVRRLGNSTTWADYATELRARKKYQEAADAAGKSVAMDPRNIHGQYELGQSLLALGQPAPAAAALTVVVAAEPYHKTGEALFALATALHLAGDREAARDRFEQLMQRASRPQFLMGQAALLFDCGDHAAARAIAQRVIDDADHVPDYHRREVRPWVRRARRFLSQLAKADS